MSSRFPGRPKFTEVVVILMVERVPYVGKIVTASQGLVGAVIGCVQYIPQGPGYTSFHGVAVGPGGCPPGGRLQIQGGTASPAEDRVIVHRQREEVGPSFPPGTLIVMGAFNIMGVGTSGGRHPIAINGIHNFMTIFMVGHSVR